MKRLLSYIPFPTRLAILLLPLLFLIDILCYQVTLPLTITIQHNRASLSVGSTKLDLGKVDQPLLLLLAPHDPLVHEYQIDGSDSTNNLNLDTNYLSQIADSPYYRLQAWMRDLAGTSRWRDLTVQANGRTVQSVAWPNDGSQLQLHSASTLQISVQLQRPETAMSLDLLLSDKTLQITLDRNNRKITVVDPDTQETVASAFFPTDVAPFAAMIVDTLVRITLWAIAVLLFVQCSEAGPGLLRAAWKRKRQPEKVDASEKIALADISDLAPDIEPLTKRRGQFFSRFDPSGAIHPIGLIGLSCSLIFVLWIALKEYQAQPHIYDAIAYLFAARTYASGHLAVPAPPVPGLFPGPFLVVFNKIWFAQYEPGTALSLVPGIWLNAPWLVEPVLGTLALLGIGLIAARLYDRRVATLAVLLGCLSPFYSYLAASYLSHAVALFYLVWGLWALLRFAQGEAGWNMAISGFCFGMAFLTRDLVTLLYIGILIPGVLLLTWKQNKHTHERLHWVAWWLVFIAIAVLFANFYFLFNLLLTTYPFITPRTLFSPGDQWGFGKGIGFYGQHTLAAGLVNLDELLTILQIDLFGWPFYFTLVFVLLPFLTRKASKVDLFLLIALVLTAGSYIGYFYHGIYLGPRYLFEDLPFLLILSSRGILTLGTWGIERGQAADNWLRRVTNQDASGHRPVLSLATLALVGALILCNLLYYLPRQATLYQNYSGLPPTNALDVSQVYQSPLHHAIVVTDDQAVYQLVLFALNDPELKGNVIYAYAYTPKQYQQLLKEFPGRALYLLVINEDNSVSYVQYTPAP